MHHCHFSRTQIIPEWVAWIGSIARIAVTLIWITTLTCWDSYEMIRYMYFVLLLLFFSVFFIWKSAQLPFKQGWLHLAWHLVPLLSIVHPSRHEHWFGAVHIPFTQPLMFQAKSINQFFFSIKTNNFRWLTLDKPANKSNFAKQNRDDNHTFLAQRIHRIHIHLCILVHKLRSHLIHSLYCMSKYLVRYSFL